MATLDILNRIFQRKNRKQVRSLTGFFFFREGNINQVSWAEGEEELKFKYQNNEKRYRNSKKIQRMNVFHLE